MLERNYKLDGLISNIEKVIVGKKYVIEKIIVCLISGGHMLIEDVPGVGKTMIVQALAKSIGCNFKRIQFTPDLLPSDITGVAVYNQKIGDFEFKFGPIMSQIILADEINRTSPKTQSSLLEAMEEHQITADGKTYKLSEPFMVLATQNPIEYEGTFPLPEAQLDRFMMKISIGYPDEEYELTMIKRFKNENPLNNITKIVDSQEILEIRENVKNVYVDEKLERYILAIVKATRQREEILLGASPRATLNLYRASQGRAMVNSRDYVTPDDIKSIAVSVLAHRLILKTDYRIKGLDAETIINKILSTIPVPGVNRYA
jgi:MoxR-like ATPase